MGGIDSPRPSPDALLKNAQESQRGRLKLFLGAAPGVGKTYEMLIEAHARKRDGLDVVVGVVEHHGRDETRNLLHGLEVLPRRQIDYRGQVQKEMDLDAILKRRPRLVLVDELAHSNVEGSRHPKRWMDVQELLGAGIDVFSTMNVQHLESANDIVAKITHVVVRETVPDSLLDMADEIEVVDVTPEELRQRLAEGKVYPQEAAQRALANFFSAGNITALRELALRRAAERVDESMRAYRAAQGGAEPWEASERILACIDPTPAALTVVRRSKRLAARLHAPFEVVHIELPEGATRASKEHLLEAFRLAEELGAKTSVLSGDDPAAEILAYAQTQNITHIVLSGATRPFWVEAFRGSIIRRLVREAGDITIEICPRAPVGTASLASKALSSLHVGGPGGYLASAFFVAIATAFAITINSLIDLPNISLVFVLAVIASAIRYGLVASIFTAVISALAYNFFLIPPLYTFTIADPSNIYANVLFVAIAATVSGVASRTRAQTLIARRQARQAADLEAYARALVGADTSSEIAEITANSVEKLFGGHTVVLCPVGDDLEMLADAPGPETLLLDDMAAAKWAFAQKRSAGWGSDTLHGAKWLFVPAPSEKGAVAVLGLRPENMDSRLSPEQRRLLDLIALQAGAAFDRAILAQEAGNTRVAEESDRLKGVLLSAISHDLRTPLSAIRSALESLNLQADRLDDDGKKELAAIALEETHTLTRFVQGLLDMTRIEAGALTPKRMALEPVEFCDDAIQMTSAAVRARLKIKDVSKGLPKILADASLAKSALINVLENAAKFSDPAPIELRAFRKDQFVAFEVLDSGPGFSEEALGNIFGKFSRGVETDGRAPGVGLGLAIANGFMTAQGGSIIAQNRKDGAGASVTLLLPIAED